MIKLSSFLETWVPKQSCGFAEVPQISQIGTNLINVFGDNQRAELRAVVEAMKGRVRANLDHMVNLYDAAPARGETSSNQQRKPEAIAAS